MATSAPSGPGRWIRPTLVVMLIAGALVSTAIAKPPDNGNGAGKCTKRHPCDTTPPVVTIATPAHGSSASGTMTIEGTAVDDVTVAAVTVAVDGSDAQPADGAATWRGTLDTTSLPDGRHDITVVAADAAGNLGVASVSVEVSNAPPEEPTEEPTAEPTSTPPPPEPEPEPEVVEPPPAPTGATCTVRVDRDLAQALRAAPEGATVCLSGTFEVSSSVVPRAGQTLVGPATIIGRGALDVFSLKANGTVRNVTFIDLDISGAERHGIGCWIGTTVIGGRLHHNAKDGLGCDLEGQGPVLVDGVEIDHNGSNAWLGAGAAGIKWFHSHGVTVTNSYVHDNYGNGVWCDAQCGDFTVTNNRIEANFRKGVFYEKGGASDMRGVFYEGFLTVTGNTIRGNNTEGVAAANAGVSIYASKNARVANNTFGANGRAVIVRNDTARLNDDKHGWIVENVTVRDGRLNGDGLVGCDVAGVACSGNA